MYTTHNIFSSMLFFAELLLMLLLKIINQIRHFIILIENQERMVIASLWAAADNAQIVVGYSAANDNHTIHAT